MEKEGSVCESHNWASVGVVSRGDTVSRIWECERCAAWTAQPFESNSEVDWDDTWLAGR